MMKRLISKSLAEFIGTFAIVFFGCGSIALASQTGNQSLLGSIPLIFGLVVAFMIYAVGHISGAHFNPAVTLAFTVVRRFSPREVLSYWIAQFLGALTACFVLSIVVPHITTYGMTSTSLTVGSALLVEVLLSFFLMFVIIAVATDSRAVGMMAGAAIGMVVAVAAYFGGPLTGASMNPARSLAPALFEGKTDQLWIYFIGPFIGTILAAMLYELIRCEQNVAVPENKKHAKGCC